MKSIERQSTVEEGCFLRLLADVEDLAEKKVKIYARLLTDASLAEDMELLAVRHAKRKLRLESLASGKSKSAEKRKNEADCGAQEQENDGEAEE